MTPQEFDREQIRAWIEEATCEGLSVDDPLPDTLAAHAEALGMRPIELRIWIHDHPKSSWSAGELTSWARPRGFARALHLLCAHCGVPVDEPCEHVCQKSEAHL